MVWWMLSYCCPTPNECSNWWSPIIHFDEESFPLVILAFVVFQTLSRLGNVTRTLIQQSTREGIVGARYASKKKRRDDCLDDKKETVKEEKKDEKSAEACVDLNFKKKVVNIYDYDDCLPPKFLYDKDCSTLKVKKAACNTKKRNIPTGCRKYSMYTDVQKSFHGQNTYVGAGFQRRLVVRDDTDYLYTTKNRSGYPDPTSKIMKRCNPTAEEKMSSEKPKLVRRPEPQTVSNV